VEHRFSGEITGHLKPEAIRKRREVEGGKGKGREKRVRRISEKSDDVTEGSKSPANVGRQKKGAYRRLREIIGGADVKGENGKVHK